MKYVIIGNSAAAVGCVEGIRAQDTQGEIVIISEENMHAYSRPLISYLLMGKIDERSINYRPNDFYEQNGCTVLMGKVALRINEKRKTVTLDDGEHVGYDKLLVATGSRPFMPLISGLEKVENQFTFMSMYDAKTLGEALSFSSRVLIIGAGLIGLKCAEGVFNKVESVTVVDLADRILPSILDEQGSEIFRRCIEERGVRFILGTGVQKFADNQALLKNGEKVDFDILVMAVGVRPNVELVKDIDGDVDKGILVNELCETSLKDIYAAGDCTQSLDVSTGERRVMALLPNAYMQGEVAGQNMAGGDARYDKGIPMNAIGFFDLHMVTAGSYTGHAYVEEGPGCSYKKLVTADGVLKGYILIEQIQRAGIYTSLVRERTPLDNIDFELIKQQPQLMAFSRKQRESKLGGPA